ncbi:uncharacterized protein isoform X2 [Leptinotarsa decemlineata]|uniref:uncharacterized protein isoform X2 n=1 Tax=Leptinotarsa decemlineata TaxID=7539 RepID=UPI003D309202
MEWTEDVIFDFITKDDPEGWLDQDHLYNSEEDIKPSITDTELSDGKWNSESKQRKKNACVDEKVGYYEHLEKSSPNSKERDECTIFGELLAVKLRKIEENKRQLVMHAIDNIMFEAICESKSNAPLYTSYLNQVNSQPRDNC